MITTCLLMALTVCQSQLATWPTFLGAGAIRPEASASTSQLPLTWSPEQGILWTCEIEGHGQSSPVAWGELLFVTSIEGPNKERCIVTCVSLKDGKPLWRQTVDTSFPVKNSLYVSRAAPTPVVDAERVVCLFESGDCVAYSHAGELLWQRELQRSHGPFIAEFGLGASPCQTDQHVFVLLEHDGPSHLLALSKTTGEVTWEAARSPRRSWSSPAMLNVAGQPQIVVSSAGTVDGYNPADGNLLWSFNEIGGNTGTTPIDCGDGRFLVGASAGRQGENAAAAATSNCMLQVSRVDDQWQVKKLWHNADAAPSWGSPILHQGLAYWVNRVGVVCCIDSQTGDTLYQGRTKQSCWATPLADGQHIYLFGKDGLTSVIASGSKFEVLAENRLWNEDQPPTDASLKTEETTAERQQAAAMFSGPTVYGYAVAGDKIVVRIGNRLYCLDQ